MARGQAMQPQPRPPHCVASSAALPAPHPPHPHFGRRTAVRFWSGFHPQARSQSTRVQSPIVAAVSCFFVNDPTIDFDLTGLLNVGDMPVLSGIIRKVLR